jgi:hypothetical protein
VVCFDAYDEVSKCKSRWKYQLGKSPDCEL